VGVLGDSRSTQAANTWGADLITSLNADWAGSMVVAEENPRTWASGGQDLSEAVGWIDDRISYHTLNPNVDKYIFFINFGIIEAVGETEANFESNYLYIIDALRVKFPGCIIFLTYPWSANDPTRGATIKPYINDVIAARTGVYAGDDEGVWAENGDNGATMYYDGLHYATPTGQAGKVVALLARLLAVVGY
jgi:hypothetical protein